MYAVCYYIVFSQLCTRGSTNPLSIRSLERSEARQPYKPPAVDLYELCDITCFPHLYLRSRGRHRQEIGVHRGPRIIPKLLRIRSQSTRPLRHGLRVQAYVDSVPL